LGSVNASKNIGGLVGFIDNVDADHITWQGNEWDRSAKTILTTNNFYYKPSESTLNCNDQLEISECTSKDNISYFKNTSSVVPFISITENPDLTYWQWNFIGGTEDQPGPVWYVQTNDYPKFTQQTIFPDPTCSDGILNQNETGIDSGGVCTPVRRQGGGGFLLYSQRINIAPAVVPIIQITPTIQEIKFIFTKNLKKGMIDNEVKELQKFLNAHGFQIALTGPGSKGFETTTFGSLTKKVLIKFQLSKGLNADGIVGPLTRVELNK
jgi:peptidoglycan hydrolase-like protein with peptidoglycan-binding domain